MPNRPAAQLSLGRARTGRKSSGKAVGALTNLAVMRGRASLLLVTALALLPTSAGAADVPGLDLRRLDLPTDHEGGIYTEPTRAPGPLNWNAALVSSYANRLVVLKDDAGNRVAIPVRHQLSLDYLFGVGLGDRIALGVVLPSAVYQTGTNLSARVSGATSLPKSALGDVKLSVKAVLLPAGELGGFSLAALARVTLPTGDPTSYISERSTTGVLRLLSELNLVAFSLRATAGARVRGAERSYLDQTFGHELPWGAAFVVRPQALGWDDKGRWSWSLEAHGAVSMTPSFASAGASPAALGAVARYTPSEISILAGVEAPLSSAVGVPSVRGVLGIGWAARFYDADQDGIEEPNNECAELAEDRDGFQDADGCPDFDNDDDGVGDESDKCPSEKEDADEFEDEDGCLDPDDDHDGIPDARDACPREAGPDAADPKLRGCPLRDRDMDGIYDADDKCPKKAEDRDGFEDGDGCPDPDNDQDGIPDTDDACPALAGMARESAKLNGCPSPDQDGDSYDDGDDKCPQAAETFDGFEDADGCPDSDAKKPRAPLARFDDKAQSIRLAAPITFEPMPRALELSEKSKVALRAVAALVHERPGLTLLVGVKPQNASPAALQEALDRTTTIVLALRKLTHRDDVAEGVSSSAVAKLPGAAATAVGIAIGKPSEKPKPSAKP